MATERTPIQVDGNSDVGPPQGEQLTTILDTLNQQLNRGGDVMVDMEQDSLSDPTRTHGHTHADPLQQAEAQPLTILIPYLSKFGIFVLIILLKVLYSHRYGLLIIIAAVGTWYHADSILTTQITLRGHSRHKQFVAKLSWVIIFLSLSLVGIYYFLDKDHFLLYRLGFQVDGLEEGLEIWTLLWLLIINDYVVKYCTIIIKSLLTLTPKTVISNQQKGSLYSLLERVTELYRSLLPVVPWYFFLLGSSDGPWFSAVLFVAYVVFKFLNIYSKWVPLKTSIVRAVTTNVSYGRRPSANDLADAGGTCPVCHEDEYTDPVMLNCKHIFCEDCVLVWFDKETSCPMCRAQIITGDNSFRDGSSSLTVQFF